VKPATLTIERTACSDRELRAEELVLLTMKPPPANVRSFKTPPLHIIALVERMDRGGGRTELGAVVNILTGDKGMPTLRCHSMACLPYQEHRALRLHVHRMCKEHLW
jgi:hypothetical protein